MGEKTVGSIEWRDLTVTDAGALRDFYSEVVGWSHSSASQGDYDDYNMHDSAGEVVTGICHARGGNANIPPQWLMYVTVEDLTASIASCTRLGGTVVDGPRSMGADSLCIIRDPAGAVLALYQKG